MVQILRRRYTAVCARCGKHGVVRGPRKADLDQIARNLTLLGWREDQGKWTCLECIELARRQGTASSPHP